MSILLAFLLLIGHFCAGFIACIISWNAQLKDQTDTNHVTDVMILVFALGYISLFSFAGYEVFRRTVGNAKIDKVDINDHIKQAIERVKNGGPKN